MDKKKLCIIASAPSGIVSFWKTNIEKISEEFDVYVVANFNQDSIFDEIKIAGCKSINIERRPSIKSFWFAVIKLARYFKKEKFDGFISMSSNASLVASVAGRLARIPFRARIFTGQIWANRTGLFRWFFQTIDRITIFLNTDILVDGYSQQEFLEEKGILKKGISKVLANGSICGVDVTKFSPSKEIRIQERKRLGIRDSDIVFTFMGRLNREKGIYELLEAFNILAKDYTNIKLLLIGRNEGIDISIFEKYDNICINHNLIFYGYTNAPYYALQAGDIFCLPSYREGFGMSVIEASSLAMPVITSDAYGLRDSFVEGVTGKKCKVKDVDTLYNCMKYFYVNNKEIKKFGEAGRERVKKFFSMDLVSSAWFEYFKKNL